MNQREMAAALHRLELLKKIRIRRLMVSLGIHPGQPRMMEYISNHPGCTQREVATALDITQASAAASLKRLEKAGFLVRVQDEEDGRRNCLTLTPLGQNRMIASREGMNQLHREMFQGMEEEDMITFKALCDRMFDNLADETTKNLSICQMHREADNIISQQEET